MHSNNFLKTKKYFFTQITQPRRIAAIALAKRVSEEMGTKLGDKVAY